MDLNNSDQKIIHLPPLEEGDMRRRLPDNRKMLDIIQRPLISLDEGLKSLIAQPQYILK